MPLAIPPDLKKITPFVRRAEELDRDKGSAESRLVAYYCRQYAVHIGIPLSSSSPGAKTCLGHLLESLEKEKPAMDNFTRDESAFLCRKFATNVFDKADAEDRGGQADKNTAKTFYAAASFLQILEQFFGDGDDSDEVAEDKKRILYAKWKATEILKAINEGRQPDAGGYMEGDVSEMTETTNFENIKDDEKKLDAPTTVVTITDDNDDDPVENGLDLFPPPAPTTAPTNVAPPSGGDVASKNVHLPDEGMEVELGAPPQYPGQSIDSTINASDYVDLPKLSFNLPPALPPVAVNIPPSPPKAKITSLFGFNKKAPVKANKAQIADAAELTRFALSALEDKDAELAAERLQQALKALGC